MTPLKATMTSRADWKTSLLHEFDDGASEEGFYQSIGKQMVEGLRHLTKRMCVPRL